MIKYIASFEKLRKRAALSIAILIAITVVFITIMTGFVNELYREVNEITKFEAERVEDFLAQSLRTDRNFLLLWEKDWDVYVKAHEDSRTQEELINNFIERRLTVVRDVSIASVVLFIKYDNEIIFLDYGDERYEEYRHTLENLTIVTPPSKEQIILNDPTFIGRFGSGDRIFLTGTTLNFSEDTPLYLFIGFHEKIMYESFVNTLNLELTDEIKESARSILYFSIIYLLIVIGYGLVLIFLIRWFTYKTMIWFAKIYPFGEIAIKKGYLTQEQVVDCLAEQDEDFKNLENK